MLEMDELTDFDLSGLRNENCRKYIKSMQKKAQKAAPLNGGSLK